MHAPSLLADRARGFIPSPVRDVFNISMSPGMISLAGGNPDLSLLPLEWVPDTAARLLRDRGEEMLAYGSGYGSDSARAAVRSVMTEQSPDVEPEAIQITAGSQMGLDVVLKLLTDPGDVVLTETLTYTGALSLMSGGGVEARGVDADADGIVPEALREAIGALRREGRGVKLLYLVPDFNNPSGVSLADGRREEVVRICREAGILVVEDAPYRLLAFDGRPRRSLWSIDPETVIHLGSFSKILSPGLRVGWIVSPRRLRASVRIATESTVISPPVLGQELAAEFVARPTWRDEVAAAGRAYGARFAALAAALPAGLSFTRPEGGFFTWVTLPEGRDAEPVLDAAIERRLVFVLGALFSPAGTATNQLRLAFSQERPEVLAEGGRRLGEALGAVGALGDAAAAREAAG